MKSLLKIMLFLMLVSLLFSGCTPGGTDDGTGGDDIDYSKIKVMLTVDDGITVTSENPIYIEEGERAEFTVKFGSTYTLDTLSHGTYESGKVTVEGLTKNTIVNMTSIDVGYSTSKTYRFFFSGMEGDECSVRSGAELSAGTKVTVKANEPRKSFIGWSLGGYTTDVSKMLSTDREFTFRLSPELSVSEVFKIYANYADSDCYYYDLNGGSYKSEGLTKFSRENTFYETELSGSRFKVSVSSSYLEVIESVCLFFDDGNFYRDGYVLTEYNTKPDGTGEGYSLGSKYFIDAASDGLPVLYLIWEKAEDASQFTYKDFNNPNPTTAAKAPHWQENGIMITSYLGDSGKVVIPETIDGKYVTGIAEGAFQDKSMHTLVLSKYITKIEDGAFVGCSELETLYYPDSIYEISNDAFDSSVYESLKHLYVNATMAPRHSKNDGGAYSVKLSRLLASEAQNRIIMIAGSSAFQGFSSEYMEALLDDQYRVINFGTTRTTNGMIYLEAIEHYAHEGDVILYAPENSTYMMGENELYWKTLRDIENMYNLYRCVDISNYTNVFSAFSDFNKNYRYTYNPVRHEEIYDVITTKKSVNKYGEYQNAKRVSLVDSYVDAYFITMNNRYKSKFDTNWDDTAGQLANKDYTDPNNKTWESIDSERLSSAMNRAIDAAKSSGAKVYFSFSPVDADKIVPEAQNCAWLLAYDKLIADTFVFDGVLGSSIDYVYAHEYFYDCAFHLNDVGRTYRTYQVYLDFCSEFGLSIKAFDSVGSEFEGCIFDPLAENGKPPVKPEYLE